MDGKKLDLSEFRYNILFMVQCVRCSGSHTHTPPHSTTRVFFDVHVRAHTSLAAPTHQMGPNKRDSVQFSGRERRRHWCWRTAAYGIGRKFELEWEHNLCFATERILILTLLLLHAKLKMICVLTCAIHIHNGILRCVCSPAEGVVMGSLGAGTTTNFML